MFGLPPFFSSTRIREGWAQFLSEFLATFGLMLVILVCSRYQPASIPYAVAAYVTAAYWLFSSTSFANPAVTMARSMTDTFSGIRPVDVPTFVLAQLLGGSAAVAFSRWLSPQPTPAISGK
jgi:glycerol uptake facilitator-like aquaporin